MRELDPTWVDLNVALVYRMLGRLDDSHHAMVAYFEQIGPPGDRFQEAAKRGWAEGGWEGQMRALLTQVGGASPATSAVGYAWIGETDEAFALLERGYSERDPQMLNIKIHPAFDPLRSDPRLDDLLRRMKHTEAS